MKKVEVTKAVLDVAVEVMGYKRKEQVATMSLRDGRMTTHLHIYDTPQGEVFVNISNAVTYYFETKEAFTKYADKKFKFYNSEKEMYIKDWGMTEESWEEWNKAE